MQLVSILFSRSLTSFYLVKGTSYAGLAAILHNVVLCNQRSAAQKGYKKTG
jgi:hypothetical protein